MPEHVSVPDDDFDDYFEPKPIDYEEDSPRGKHSAPDELMHESTTIRPESHFGGMSESIVELPDLDAIRAKAQQAEELPVPAPVPHLPSPSIPGVKEVTYSQPYELAQSDPNAKGPWIQYNGVATVRILTPSDWAAAGVKSTKYCEWNYLNNKRLPRSMFTDEELQYLLRIDGRFSLERQ